MNSNSNQQFNCPVPSNPFGGQSFGGHQQSFGDFDCQSSFAVPSHLKSNNNDFNDSFNNGCRNSFNSNPQSSSASFPSPSFNPFPSPSSPFGERCAPSSSRSTFGQLDARSNFGGQQPVMVADHCEQTGYLLDEPEQDQLDLVQNYGVRDSEVYREKRDRNNAAVRKARRKFQKKNQDVISRLEVLREENRQLQHQKDIVQRVHDELQDLNDQIAFHRNEF